MKRRQPLIAFLGSQAGWAEHGVRAVPRRLGAEELIEVMGVHDVVRASALHAVDVHHDARASVHPYSGQRDLSGGGKGGRLWWW